MNGKKLRKNISSLFSIPSLLTTKPGAANLLSKAAFACLIVSLTFGLHVNDSYAQDRVEVTGVVTDASDGSPLPGATIIVQGSGEATGSTIGTTTDMDGNYTIRVPQDLNVLVVSFIGYLSQEVQIDGRTEVNIQMQPDIRMLDDVVVVGYGVQDRREITSSVASVSADQFNRGNINDAQELLQGKVAGLQITRPGGDPNAGFSIRLRGLSTIGANTEPLVVIDGVIGASFNSVDPNDIASMEVLKDASAAAIYGTRGSNGVILITTKSGDAVADGGISVNYNGQISTSFVANRYETLTPEEYRELGTRGITINDLGASTNWWEEVTQTAYTQSHSLAVSGGTGTTNYRVSGNFRDVQGIQKGTGNQQLNARLNLNHRALNDRLTLNANLSVTNRENQIGLGEVFRYAATFNPTAPIDNPGSGFDNFNPLQINEWTTWDQEQSRYIIGLRGEYDFSDVIDGLSGAVFYSRENEDFFQGEYYNSQLRFRGAGRNGLARREMVNNSNQLFETTFNYRNTFDWVRVESVAGYSYQEFEGKGQFVEGGDFVTDSFLYNNMGASREFNRGLGSISSFLNQSKLIAFFGRVNMTFDNTYFLSGTFRREGSTRFGAGNKWGNFFAVSGGAELTNLIDIPRADEFKLRVSYGQTGQNAPFDGISLLRFGPGASFLVDGQFVPSLGPVSNPNPDLKWEVKKEVNFGVDFAFFNDRLSGSVDYYSSRTEDLLLEFGVPVPPNLFPLQWVNIGEISNKGIELALSYQALQTPDANWTTGITFATYNTVLESLSSGDLQFGDRQLISNMGAPGLNNTQIIRVQEGAPIGDIWGPRFAGFSTSGEWLFFNANGDIVNRDQLTTADNQVIGNGMPDFTLGWDNTFNYRGWDFNMFWRGAFGHDLVNSYDVFYKNPTVASAYNISREARDLELRQSPTFSSYYVESADFLRLENVTVGYTLDLRETAAIRDVRFFVSGNNLWTITGYGGVDPEVRFADPGPSDNAGRVGGGNPLAPGIERRNNWFTQTSLVFGVNLGF
ncbi:MAG: SusC/RagA family TonB-linked outer membrane protein [Balneolaceae bacterium]|nr:SusC/RagA family TonB-linked outer membrane protein [Balneolaceae bacterium]